MRDQHPESLKIDVQCLFLGRSRQMLFGLQKAGIGVSQALGKADITSAHNRKKNDVPTKSISLPLYPTTDTQIRD